MIFGEWIYSGLYEIKCLNNNKKYIGKAENVLDRLSRHSCSLIQGINDCKELQQDWNMYGPNQF